MKLDLRHTDLGQKQRPTVIRLSQHRLRKLAIEQSRNESAYFRFDTCPDYVPLQTPKKGTRVVENISPYRSGVFLKQVNGQRFDRCLVQYGDRVEMSSLYVLRLQAEQLKLF